MIYSQKILFLMAFQFFILCKKFIRLEHVLIIIFFLNSKNFKNFKKNLKRYIIMVKGKTNGSSSLVSASI